MGWTKTRIEDSLEEIGLDEDEIEEAYENMGDMDDDFEIGNYRFIRDDKIDDIQKEELESDEYILGSFNAEFLGGLSDMPLDADDIRNMQDAEAFEAIGKLL